MTKTTKKEHKKIKIILVIGLKFHRLVELLYLIDIYVRKFVVKYIFILREILLDKHSVFSNILSLAFLNFRAKFFMLLQSVILVILMSGISLSHFCYFLKIPN